MKLALRYCASVALFLSASVAASEDQEGVFAALSEAERHRVEPTLADGYFQKGFPSRYLRHRLVRVQKDRLKFLLDSDLDARSEGKATQGVALNLFDDLVVRIAVDQTIRNEFHGATAYYGRGASGRPAATGFNCYFHDSGYFKAVVHTEAATYLIENALDNTYFVILAQKPIDHPFD